MDDDLPRELLRLEGRLTSARIREELATIREGLDRASGSVQLANVRIATPCKVRWDDMVGDDRVRACSSCDRPVFNLSELTRAEAEALLATRGLTPCVRFYRRADGTIMTADCPTRPPARRLRVVAFGTALAGSSPAMADPDVVEAPPEVIEIHDTVVFDESVTQGIVIENREMGIPISTGQLFVVPTEPTTMVPAIPSVLESSLTVRLGYGIASHSATVAARSTRMRPPLPDSASLWEGAVTGDLTLPIALDGDLRLGVWGELRTSSNPVAGGELIVKGLGPSVIALRAGGNTEIATGALAVGHHMVGVRIVASMNRSLAEPHDWSATLGLEVDPLRALGYVLGFGE